MQRDVSWLCGPRQVCACVCVYARGYGWELGARTVHEGAGSDLRV